MTRILIVALALLSLAGCKKDPAQNLVGKWAIDEVALTQTAQEMEKAGKKDEAAGLAMMAAFKMTFNFNKDGTVDLEMANPMDAKAAAKKETSKYVVASTQGTTLTLKITDTKKNTDEETTVAFKDDDTMSMTSKGTSIPLKRTK